MDLDDEEGMGMQVAIVEEVLGMWKPRVHLLKGRWVPRWVACDRPLVAHRNGSKVSSFLVTLQEEQLEGDIRYLRQRWSKLEDGLRGRLAETQHVAHVEGKTK